MSAWIVGLAIAAGYLINKQAQIQNAVSRAEAEYQGAAKPSTTGVTSSEVRAAWKNTNYSTYGDFNSDLSQAEKDHLVAGEHAASEAVQAYDGTLPQIQGVMLTFDRYG